MTNTVTGATTEVTFLVDLPRERLWQLVTDVPRYGEWSPECEYTEWQDKAEGRSPRTGDRFAGRNRFGEDFVTHVVCEITEFSPLESFAWIVLDEDYGADKPASIWRYELSATDSADRTRLRHSFEHGPGATMVRIMAEENPTIVPRRLAELRQNMVTSIAAMLDGENYREETR